ncbi:hypothetical protein [Adlercreutzia sp. ZJ154]|uniref:hypothetical protein n=1 Tax=Adlercreutzia sp. ZJ154 TaxID=2709790 RepID=UPI0013EE1255|nr:hypothetical protein [Adlercreutzia sp. ZJ154]
MTDAFRNNQKANFDQNNLQQNCAGNRVRGYGMGSGVPPVAPQMPTQSNMQSQGGYVQPATSQSVPASKRKHKARFWVAIVIAIVAIVAAILLAFTLCNGPSKSARQGDLGQLEGKTPEEIQAELDRVVEEGMFNISIASYVEFENGTAPGELRIENVPANNYLMRVEITRDDTGEKIYETDMIEPNYHIQSDTLDVALPKGSYACTATFSAYDKDTEELVGQAAAKIDIEVLN